MFAGGDDQVDPGFGGSPTSASIVSRSARRRSMRPMPVARGAACARRPRRPASAPVRQPERHRAQRRGLRQRGQVGVRLVEQRVPDRQRDAVLQADLVAYGVDEVVHPRQPVGVGAGQAGQAQLRPLDRHGGVRAGHLDDRLGGALGQLPGLAHDLRGPGPACSCTPPRVRVEDLQYARLGAQQVQRHLARDRGRTRFRSASSRRRPGLRRRGPRPGTRWPSRRRRPCRPAPWPGSRRARSRARPRRRR